MAWIRWAQYTGGSDVMLMEGSNAYDTYTTISNESSECSAVDSSTEPYTTNVGAQHAYEEVEFDDLYAEYGHYVYNIIRRVVGQQDAEDVAQQAWIKVWRGSATFRGEAKVSSWLFRVAQNTAISHLRQCRARIQPEVLPEDPCVYADCVHPDTKLERREQRSELARRIRRLSGIHREAIIASLDDTTLESRSLRLGVSVRTLKTRTWRARQLVTVV